jgi:TonB family protein
MFENLVETCPPIDGKKSRHFVITSLLYGVLISTLFVTSVLTFNDYPEALELRSMVILPRIELDPPPVSSIAVSSGSNGSNLSESYPRNLNPPQTVSLTPATPSSIGRNIAGLPQGRGAGFSVDGIGLNASNPSNGTNANNGPLLNMHEEPPEIEKEIRPEVRQISKGVINSLAVHKPVPVYPLFAKRAGVSGTVTVRVLVDERGSVIEANAVEGPPLLRPAAVDAALRARFSPTLLSGVPVRVTGMIHYRFILE